MHKFFISLKFVFDWQFDLTFWVLTFWVRPIARIFFGGGARGKFGLIYWDQPRQARSQGEFTPGSL